MAMSPIPAESRLRTAAEARRRVDRLLDRREERLRRSVAMAREFDELNAYLAIAGDVTAALEQLGRQLFEELLAVVEKNLTVALQEILEQPLVLKAKTEFKRDVAVVELGNVNGPVVGLGIAVNPAPDVLDAVGERRHVVRPRYCRLGLRHGSGDLNGEVVHQGDEKMPRTHGGVADFEFKNALGRVEHRQFV